MSIQIKSPSTIKPAFQNITRVFKNRLFSNASTYENILANAEARPYIGSLPKDIIETVISSTHSKEEKTKLIKSIMEAFSRAARVLKGTEKKLESTDYAATQKSGLQKRQTSRQNYYRSIQKLRAY